MKSQSSVHLNFLMVKVILLQIVGQCGSIDPPQKNAGYCHSELE